MYLTERRMKYVFFFFQAEDGIRDLIVTGVQTCALPISPLRDPTPELRDRSARSRLHPRDGPRRPDRLRGPREVVPADVDRPGGRSALAHEADLRIGSGLHVRGPGTGREPGVRNLQGLRHPRDARTVHHATRAEGRHDGVRARAHADPLAQPRGDGEERGAAEPPGEG